MGTETLQRVQRSIIYKAWSLPIQIEHLIVFINREDSLAELYFILDLLVEIFAFVGEYICEEKQKLIQKLQVIIRFKLLADFMQNVVIVIKDYFQDILIAVAQIDEDPAALEKDVPEQRQLVLFTNLDTQHTFQKVQNTRSFDYGLKVWDVVL